MKFLKNLIYKNKVSKETFWAYIAKCISIFGGLFIVIFIPRFAGAEIYGGMSLILAYMAVSGIFFGAPIETAVKKEVTKNKFNSISKKYFIEGFKLKIIFSILFFSVLFLVLSQLNASFLKAHFFEFFLLSFVINFWGLVVNVFEATHRLFFETVMYFIEYSTKIILILFFILFSQLTVSNILYSFIGGYFLAFLVGLVILVFKFPSLQIRKLFFIFHLNKRVSKKILYRTFFLSLTGMSFVILTRLDTIMIGHFLTQKAVGLYNVSSNITFNITMLSIPLILGVIPLFINSKNIKKLLHKNIKKLILINSLIFITLFLASNLLINFLYGLGFESSIAVLKILAIFPLFSSLQNLAQQILILKDKTKQIFFLGIVAVVLNVILNIVLIPAMGINGAAIATIISYGIWAAISLLYVIKLNNL